MALLPGLESELVDAHARRSRRRVPRLAGLGGVGSGGGARRGWAAMMAGAGVAVAVAVALLVAGSHRAARPSAAGARGPGGTVVLVRDGRSTSVYPTPFGLFVVRFLTSHSRFAGSDLMRVDPASGRLIARRHFDGSVADVVVSGAAVWAAEAGRASDRLWRLDPRSLTTRASALLPPAPHLAPVRMASAPNGLWIVRPGALDRFSFDAASVVERLALHDLVATDVAEDASGRWLAIVPGLQVPRIDLRDPATGRRLGTVHLPVRATALELGGIHGETLWIDGATVNRRFTIAFDLHRAAHGAIRYGAPGRFLSATLFSEVLWVVDGGTRPASNHWVCADPRSGALRGAVPVPPASDIVGADAQRFYYLAGGSAEPRGALVSAPIPPACR